MRTIEPTSVFKRDFKREAKGRYAMVLQTEFPVLLQNLADDVVLDPASVIMA